MADQADVEAALAGAVGAALYPGGLAAPCAVAGAVVRIYRGFPVAAALDSDLAAGRSNVSVSAAEGVSETTTRWAPATTLRTATQPGLSAGVAGSAVTFAGDAAPGQVAAVIAGSLSAAYRTRAGDTPASVAAALAGVLAARIAATADGAVLRLPNQTRLIARVEADQPVLTLTKRQHQTFKIACWCPDPATRDAIGATIDAALSAIAFLGLPDGSSGRLRAVSAAVSDRWEDATLYRRDLVYGVEYPTSLAQTLPRMAVGVSTQAPAGQSSLS